MSYPWLDEYLMTKKGVTKDFKVEWGWNRYMIGGKLFCAECLDDSDILPGYYMNKVHWNSVKADGNVPSELLKEMLDEAYGLVFKSLPKKKQQDICLEERI